MKRIIVFLFLCFCLISCDIKRGYTPGQTVLDDLKTSLAIASQAYTNYLLSVSQNNSQTINEFNTRMGLILASSESALNIKSSGLYYEDSINECKDYLRIYPSLGVPPDMITLAICKIEAFSPKEFYGL